ncbi:MAG: methyltransferase domain-containing protein [Deltaproteobacteria bacterium]|nr:methyltransferase domain-containing protein [Deltaproteobacteria bacterium]
MSALPQLTWQAWPLARAPLALDAAATWPATAAAVRRQARVALVQAGDLPPSAGPEWCAAVRGAGLVAGIIVQSHEVAPVAAAAAHWGPVLLALGTAGADRRDLAGALAQLARQRSPTLRWAPLDVPHCWHEGAEPDLLLLPATTASDPRCADCAARDRCPGPRPEQAIAPLLAAVSNQFDVELGERGPIELDLAGRKLRGRVVGTMPAEQVERALARGQLYLDRSQVARIDDFAGQIQLLQRDDRGCWRPAPGQPFDREEAVLRQTLAGLRGLVVDVGAGPVRYVGELRAAMQSGQLRYLAVEPDPDHLARSRTALPEGQFVRGVGEALPLASGSADAVLWLRSWNHLRNPQRAVAEALRVAKPGATLLAVDNVVFGLARRPEQLQRAHAISVGQTPFEHFRNDCATDALRTVREVAGDRVEVVQIQEVGLDSSNQWLLQLRLQSPGRILE